MLHLRFVVVDLPAANKPTVNTIQLKSVIGRFKNNKLDSDVIGASAGLICGAHCIATPFLFAAKACSVTCCAETPVWWRFIDFAFLVISFAAIWYAVKSLSVSWVKLALWLSWIGLALAILNESVGLVQSHPAFVYVPAFLIIALHFYNMRYCRCQTDCN